MQLSLHFLYKIVIFSLFFFGALAYVLAQQLHVDEKAVNFAIISGTFLSLLAITISLLRRRGICLNSTTNPVLIFILLFLYLTCVSILTNEIKEWLPSFLRYSIYIMIFYLTYYFSKTNNLSVNYITYLFVILALMAIIFGFYEILNDSVEFLNGAYRVTGNFPGHSLGFSMFIISIQYYFLFLLLSNKRPTSKIVYFFIFLSLFYLFIQSHSRLLLVSFFTSLFIAFFLSTKNVINKIALSAFFGLILIGLILIALQTDMLPRLNNLLTADSIDDSTKTRLEIITNTWSHLDAEHLAGGIGLGGFNRFFYEATGRMDVAAHNDYLLFLVEGGIFGLILYIGFQLSVFHNLFKLARALYKKNQDIYYLAVLSLASFLGIGVFGFLENPHYFYQSQSVLWFLIGYLIGQYKKAQKAELKI